MGPYFLSRHGIGDNYKIYAKDGYAATMLDHSPITKDAAEYLVAHMNHAYHQGQIAGGEERSHQMRAVLGLEAAP